MRLRVPSYTFPNDVIAGTEEKGAEEEEEEVDTNSARRDGEEGENARGKESETAETGGRECEGVGVCYVTGR